VELAPTELLELGTSALCDGGARHVVGVTAAWVGAALAGPAVTAEVAAGDNLAVQVAVAEAAAGSVVVVGITEGARDAASWGDVLALAAQQRGVAGAVVGGPVRDVAATAALGFAVFATGVTPVGPTKTGGTVGATVTVGGVEVSPGDWVVADGDGVVVLPRDDAPAIADRARAKVDKEGAIIEGLRAGRTTIELLGLDASMVRRA